MPTPSKILNWGSPYDLGELFDDDRLAGFVVAVPESGIRGARLTLLESPPFRPLDELKTPVLELPATHGVIPPGHPAATMS